MEQDNFVDEAFEYLNTQIQPKLISLLSDLRDTYGYEFGPPVMNQSLRMNEHNKKRAFNFVEKVDNVFIAINVSIDDEANRIKFYANLEGGNSAGLIVYCKLDRVTIDYIASFLKVAVNHFL